MLKPSILFAVAAMSAAMPFAAAAQVSAASMPNSTLGAPAGGIDEALLSVRAGAEKMKAEDYAGAKRDFTDAINNPAFAKLTREQRYGVYYLLALVEYELDEKAQAYDHLQQAGAVSPETRDADYWLFMCDITRSLDKDDLLADALTQAVTVSPATASDIDLHYIFMVLRRAGNLDDGGAHRQKLLEALWAAHYKPADPGESAESLWFDLFTTYADKNMGDQARNVAPSLMMPGNILAMRVDNRYRPYLAATPSKGNYKAALDTSLARDRKLVADNPRHLGVVNNLSLALIEANLLNEAQTVLDAAIAKAEQAPKGAPAFDDMDDQMNWALDTRTRLLIKLGRWDDAIAAQTKARDVALAADGDTVSQAINLGYYLTRAGRPQEALAAVKDATKASPFGLMEAESVRACAYSQLKDSAGLAKSLDYMQAHKADSAEAMTTVMECTGDADGLARFMVEQLDDPKTRNDMLIELQTYLPEPHPMPLDAVTEATWKAAAARPEVRAAVTKYGVIERFPIFGPMF